MFGKTDKRLLLSMSGAFARSTFSPAFGWPRASSSTVAMPLHAIVHVARRQAASSTDARPPPNDFLLIVDGMMAAQHEEDVCGREARTIRTAAAPSPSGRVADASAAAASSSTDRDSPATDAWGVAMEVPFQVA